VNQFSIEQWFWSWVSRIHDDNLCACMKKIFYDVMKKLNISFGGRITLRITGISSRTYYTNFKLSDIFFPHLRINRHFCYFIFYCFGWTSGHRLRRQHWSILLSLQTQTCIALHCTLTSLVCTIRPNSI